MFPEGAECEAHSILTELESDTIKGLDHYSRVEVASVQALQGMVGVRKCREKVMTMLPTPEAARLSLDQTIAELKSYKASKTVKYMGDSSQQCLCVVLEAFNGMKDGDPSAFKALTGDWYQDVAVRCQFWLRVEVPSPSPKGKSKVVTGHAAIVHLLTVLTSDGCPEEEHRKLIADLHCFQFLMKAGDHKIYLERRKQSGASASSCAPALKKAKTEVDPHAATWNLFAT